MTTITIKPAVSVKGEITVPGDKSISHRSIMLGAIANGTTTVRGFLRGGDNMATMGAFRAMGVDIADDGETVVIRGKGLHGLSEPTDVIDCGNSGTTLRLLAGALAGLPVRATLAGDASLSRRPVARVVDPLRRMGARVSARDGDRLPPLVIEGGGLTGIHHVSRVDLKYQQECQKKHFHVRPLF